MSSLDSYPFSHNRDVVQDNDNDLIHMGHAIMTFYSALIDLLGRCAPEMHVSFFPVSAHFHTNTHSCLKQSYTQLQFVKKL